jgi:hypothetical protein
MVCHHARFAGIADMIWLYIIAFIWLAGWSVVCHAVELDEGGFWSKVGNYALLFIIWPYILWMMVNDGDVP